MASHAPDHSKAEVFNPKAEEVFSTLQVLTACFASFSHGANDVANAIGPFAAIVAIYSSNSVSQTSSVPIWILALGGVGIVIGLATWGYRVIETIGHKMTKVTPCRGFTIELATATTVIFASRLGFPISSTHSQVGSVTGTGLADGIKAVNWWLFVNIFASWVFTLPFTGLVTALVFIVFDVIVF